MAHGESEGLGTAGLPEGWAGASRDIVTETGRGRPQKPRDFCREGLHNVLLIKSIRLLPGKNRIGEMVILLVQGVAGEEQGFRTAAADCRDELFKLVVR